MSKRKKSRIYTRSRGGEARYYADFRDYADVGGRREALVPKGRSSATTDPDIAAALVAKRLEKLNERRLLKVTLGIERQAGIKSFAAFHLREKAKADRVVFAYLKQVQKHLERAVAFFGAERDLNAIGVSDVREWTAHLRKMDNGRGGTLSDKTVRDHLNSLSNLYRRAASEGYVPPGFNPVGALMDKPTGKRREADWFEPHEAALLIEAARIYTPPKDKHGVGFMYPLVTLAFCSGLRKAELLGLDVEDVSFDRSTIRVRPNAHRRVKTRRSRRTVPLWPQAREALQEYIFTGPGPVSGLLFPSPRTGGMVHDLRKALDAIADRAGMAEGEFRWHRCRHTYTSVRLETFDVVRRRTEDGTEEERLVPVPLFKAARELGHSSTKLIEDRYGHVLVNRNCRSDVVEFRAEDHREQLGERLEALRVG